MPKKLFVTRLDQDDFEIPIEDGHNIFPQYKKDRFGLVEVYPIVEDINGTLPVFYGLSEQKALAMLVFRQSSCALLTYDQKEKSHVIFHCEKEIFRVKSAEEHDLTNLRVNLLPLAIAMTMRNRK